MVDRIRNYWKSEAQKLEGKTVRQKTEVACLAAEMSYAAGGRTGIVFRSPGMDRPVRMNIDENLLPEGEMQGGQTQYYYNYYPLSEIPTFRFTLAELQGMTVDSLQVTMDAYYSQQAECYALNAALQTWEKVEINQPLEQPGQYLNGKGELYLQFRPIGQELYMDISMPLITLEGRVNDAEN